MPIVLFSVPSLGNAPLVLITSLAPNWLFGWGFGFGGAAPAWPTESIEAITSITTTTSIDSPTNVVAFAVNTLLSGLTSMFFLLLFLYRLGSGLTQNPFYLPTTSYLAFLGSPPFSLRVGDMLSSITCGSP